MAPGIVVVVVELRVVVVLGIVVVVVLIVVEVVLGIVVVVVLIVVVVVLAYTIGKSRLKVFTVFSTPSGCINTASCLIRTISVPCFLSSLTTASPPRAI